MYEFVEFVARQLPHVHESDAVSAFNEAAERLEMDEKRLRYFVPPTAREAVSWEHASAALIRHGMLASPTHASWAEQLPESSPEPPPAEMSFDALASRGAS